MKKILILLLFCGFWANAQQYHDKGAKFEFATNEGDTITVNTRIPIIDEFGLINYYVDVADLLALNPAPVLEWGNITGTLSNQTDLQGALNDKADQSDLTAHTSNGNIHFTQSAISITESQVSDLKDYLRGDINDTNGANKLTLGSLEVTGQTTLQNGLNLTSIPTGTSNNILTINGSGDVEQRVFSLGDIDIANSTGVSQFPVGLGDQLRIQGSGDTSISFDGVTNTINITSIPGSGGGGAVTSFNGRTGGVVSQSGDYSTAMVNENTNLYFTESRVRGTDLTGLAVSNTPISSTNTFIQALGRLQGQINNRDLTFSAGNLSIEGGNSVNLDSRYYSIAQLNTSGFSNVHWGNLTNKPTSLSGYGITNAYTKGESDGRYVNVTGDTMTGSLGVGGDITIPNSSWLKDASGNNLIRSTASGWVNVGNTPPVITLYASSEVRLKNLVPIKDDAGYEWMNMTSGGFLRIGSGNPGAITLFGGSSPRYSDGTNNYTFWHAGNFTPSDYVPTTRTITAGDGLVGGGNLTANRTISVDATVARMNATNTGSLTVTGDVIANSDKRLKKNIKRIGNALAIVQLLGGYEYDRKDIDLHQAGVIAQEVEEVFPTAVSEDEKGIKSVAYNQLIALLIEAVKEQQIEIENLKTLINEK